MLDAAVRKLNLDAEDWQRLLSRLAAVVTVILVLLAAERLAALTWSFVPQPEIATPVLTPAMRAGGDGAQAGRRNYEQTASLHLFGDVKAVADVKPVAVVKAPEVVPETKLQMTLRGVFHTEGDGSARVIVAGPNGREEVYRIADSMPGGATLEEIEARRIVISRQGRFEALSFPEEDLVGRSASLPGASSGRDIAPVSEIDASALAARYRKAVESDPTALTDIAQVQPYIEQGTFRGFRLRPGRKHNLLRQLGLQSGDIVTAVDGAPLNSMAQAMDSLRVLGEASEVQLTVLRDGQERPILVRLN